MRVPLAAGVMHAMTRRPRVSFSSRNCLTAHCRHAPTDPIAGCQQKYGRLKPSVRHASSRLTPSWTSCGRLSMKMVATSAPRTPMVADVAVEIVAEVLQRALQRFGRSGRERAVGVPGPEQARMGRQAIEIPGLASSRFESAQQI